MLVKALRTMQSDLDGSTHLAGEVFECDWPDLDILIAAGWLQEERVKEKRRKAQPEGGEEIWPNTIQD